MTTAAAPQTNLDIFKTFSHVNSLPPAQERRKRATPATHSLLPFALAYRGAHLNAAICRIRIEKIVIGGSAA